MKQRGENFLVLFIISFQDLLFMVALTMGNSRNNNNKKKICAKNVLEIFN